MNGPNGYAPATSGAPPHGFAQGYSPYGAAPAYGQVQYPQGYSHYPHYQHYPQQGVMNPLVAPKNGGLAVALELLGGFLFQTFGIGHLYAGNVGMGLGMMLGYWALSAINFVLCFAFVGFITWPVTWVAFMIISAITANNAAKKFNVEKCGQPAF